MDRVWKCASDFDALLFEVAILDIRKEVAVMGLEQTLILNDNFKLILQRLVVQTFLHVLTINYLYFRLPVFWNFQLASLEFSLSVDEHVCTAWVSSKGALKSPGHDCSDCAVIELKPILD